jgi:hypothetical protein
MWSTKSQWINIKQEYFLTQPSHCAVTNTCALSQSVHTPAGAIKVILLFGFKVIPMFFELEYAIVEVSFSILTLLSHVITGDFYFLFSLP